MTRTISQPEPKTASGVSYGYIDPSEIRELWFQTGTICNLKCDFCFEHSGPGDMRIEPLTLSDTAPLIDEAIESGVRQFSFTGGEPFVIKDMLSILDYALDRAPCLVLTNGTKPLQHKIPELKRMTSTKKFPLSFRISIDYPDKLRHEHSRGLGTFDLSWKSIKLLAQAGYRVSIARHRKKGEDSANVEWQYQNFLKLHNISQPVHLVSFPDLESSGNPDITEKCMTTYHTPKSRSGFMCAFSRMALKKKGKVGFYACTLVDDNEDFNLGSSLKEAAGVRTRLSHPRCFSCFSGGMSCSEM